MNGAQGVAGPLVVSSILLQLAGSSACPLSCLCAADIMSCGAQGLENLPVQMPTYISTLDFSHNQLVRLEEDKFAGLPRLDTLRMAHNRLAWISHGAFRNSSRLRHLDLSSNELHMVAQHYFLELVGLEELLLFNNRITRVESKALSGLSNLRKAYFSHNRLTDFPFFSIQEHSHPSLNTLDLSSNRMPKLPLDDILALPPAVQSGLFLHNNTLNCECSMYGLFRHWQQRNFSSVRDYVEQHTCLVYEERRASVRFLRHSRFFENCSIKLQSLPGGPPPTVLVYEGDSVMVNCNTSFRIGKGPHQLLSYLWVSPDQEYVVPPGNNGSLRMFANGSLKIVGARRQDSGVYLCMALDRRHPPANESWEVNITVRAQHEGEPFNTGFTTLLGCVVSLVLVLMYLYLTPCRCWCRRRRAVPPVAVSSPGNECSAQSSILTPTPPATTEGPGRKASGNSKHVVFLEPIKEVQNGRLRATLAIPTDHPKLQQARGDTDSITSVFSDTPMVS